MIHEKEFEIWNYKKCIQKPFLCTGNNKDCLADAWEACEAVYEKKKWTREEILGAVARGWCAEVNSHKTMDSNLPVAIADEIIKLIQMPKEEDNG